MKTMGKDLVGVVFLATWALPTLALIVHLAASRLAALWRGLRGRLPSRRTARVRALMDRMPVRRTSLTARGAEVAASHRPRLDGRWKSTQRITPGAC